MEKLEQMVTMLDMTHIQQQVYRGAKEKLQVEPWFTNISINGFPTPQQIGGMGIDAAIDHVVSETREQYEPEPGED